MIRIGLVSSISSICPLCCELTFIISLLGWRPVGNGLHHGAQPKLPHGRGWGKADQAFIKAGRGMLLVTGGAGFIGSNVVAALNDAGRADLAVCDLLGDSGKWRNL